MEAVLTISSGCIGAVGTPRYLDGRQRGAEPSIAQRYDGVMRRPLAAFLRTLALVGGLCSGQIPQPPTGRSHYLEIKLPPGVISESIFIRYLLAGEEFGGW